MTFGRHLSEWVGQSHSGAGEKHIVDKVPSKRVLGQGGFALAKSIVLRMQSVG